jgi:hypothetical protein
MSCSTHATGPVAPQRQRCADSAEPDGISHAAERQSECRPPGRSERSGAHDISQCNQTANGPQSPALHRCTEDGGDHFRGTRKRRSPLWVRRPSSALLVSGRAINRDPTCVCRACFRECCRQRAIGMDAKSKSKPTSRREFITDVLEPSLLPPLIGVICEYVPFGPFHAPLRQCALCARAPGVH